MLSRFHQKIGSFLGLLAILMATLAPTVSQALAASRDANDLTFVICSAQAAPDDAPNQKSDTHPAMPDGQACGYCNLLVHMPAVPTVRVAFAVTVWAIQHRVATRFESVSLVPPRTLAQPRAPPVSS
jgi:hypothetical protein